MTVTRLIYYSQNHIDPAAGSVVRELSQILSASNRNNKPLGLTGALIFDNQWFLQILEGERGKVWNTFERIRKDERHSDVTVAEVLEVQTRIFGNWWMGLATRNEHSDGVFAEFSKEGLFNPRLMSAAQMLALMTKVAARGLSREVVKVDTEVD